MMSQPAAGAGEDTLLIRAGWQRGKWIGVKLITIVPANAVDGDLPSIQAVYLLFDGSDGRPLASLDGTELTYWKTAADSALGAQLLAREDCEEMLMVGAGAQAPHLIRAHCSVRPSIRRVRIWNRTASKAEALAASAPVAGLDFESVTDLQSATTHADLICCATAAEAPLVLGGVASPWSTPRSGWRLQARHGRDRYRGLAPLPGIRRLLGVDHRRLRRPLPADRSGGVLRRPGSRAISTISAATD